MPPVKKPAKKAVPMAKSKQIKKDTLDSGSMYDPAQPGYKKPGSSLKTVPPKRTLRQAWDEKKFAPRVTTYTKLETGITPRALNATKGNPKPSASQITAGKKASAAAQAKAKATAQSKAAAEKAAKLKAAKTAKKPTTGVYKKTTP